MSFDDAIKIAKATLRLDDLARGHPSPQMDGLNVGDKLRVRPGEKVPVDGVIIEGRSSLDESLVTGESMPVSKESGAKVIAGTLNQSGGFVMRAEKVGRDTLLSQIVQMVAQAQRSRAPIQRLADQVAGFDKQPLRDYLDVERRAGRWNGDAPAPPLPESVVDATSKRYLEAYRRVTGTELKI
ncbi:P-type ATPase [Pseudomonas aeruginosa]|uniref:P-type ATPase n=1 Tax=Pseudomonas aeruginosa TaxID=287 RepID=UPI0035BF0E05